jgi:hypothetical protein
MSYGVRARMKERGFIGPTTRRGGFARASWPTVATTWARGWLATCGGRQPMEKGGALTGECGEAAWHRP